MERREGGKMAKVQRGRAKRRRKGGMDGAWAFELSVFVPRRATRPSNQPVRVEGEKGGYWPKGRTSDRWRWLGPS